VLKKVDSSGLTYFLANTLENILRELLILHCVSQHDTADQRSRLAAVSLAG
jgi:hypothetical protein